MDTRFRFCPYCALRLTTRDSEGRPRLYCESCQEIFYGNAKPCAGAVVTDGQRILLTKRKQAPYAGCWDLPGGYLEEDEHPIQAVVREVCEETGLDVEVGPFIGIYLDRYGPESSTHTLNIFYEARPKGGNLRPASDASDVQWFELPAIPFEALAFQHEPEVIREWLSARKNEEPI